jgi:hypothetical protein
MEEGEGRRNLRDRVFALVELWPYTRQDLARAFNAGAKFVHVGFAGPFDLGDVR